MTLVAVPGNPIALLGNGTLLTQATPSTVNHAVDAANEAVIVIGHVLTSDGGSHTISTTGSSSFGWRSGSVTFANAGTTFVVGLAAVLTTAGPPARAANSADVITFDVKKTMIGGGGGTTINSWQTHVPDSGSKTIAHGDLVAFAIQMTARGGTDQVQMVSGVSGSALNRPVITTFLSGSYAHSGALPNVIITFSDGAVGYFQGSDIFSVQNTRTWSSASATKEYGQLYSFPFPVNIYGLYGWSEPLGDYDVVLYSNPLGTPVAEKTVSIDANTVGTVNARRFHVDFSSPYSAAAGQVIGAVFKPGATDISAFYRTLNSAGHRVADIGGTSSYGISRASGAFANANSSLDHYYIGLVAGAFDVGGGGAAGRAIQINNDSLVA